MCTLSVFLRHTDSLAADAADSSVLSSRNLIWQGARALEGFTFCGFLGEIGTDSADVFYFIAYCLRGFMDTSFYAKITILKNDVLALSLSLSL